MIRTLLSCRMYGTARAFSLIEMMVAIAVLALLSVIVFSMIGSSHSAAQRATNVSNLRAIGIASLSYAADHDGTLPLISHNGGWRISSGYGMWTNSAPFKLLGEDFKPGSMPTVGNSYVDTADVFYGPFTPAFNARRAPAPSGFYEYTRNAMYLGYLFFSLPPEDSGNGDDKRASPGIVNSSMYDGNPRAPLVSDLLGETIVASAGGTLQEVNVVHLDGSVSVFPADVHFMNGGTRIRYFAGITPN